MEPALARAQTLCQIYQRIAQTRMAGLPMLNARLVVETVGFAALGEAHLLGVLITPWLMSLVHAPAVADLRPQAVGRVQRLTLCAQRFEFLSAFDDQFGRHATCALFSPMDEFHNAPHARAVAEDVLRSLRAPAPNAGRRALLLGRQAA